MSYEQGFDDERRVIEERFKTMWAAETQIRFENMSWKEPDDEAWVALTIQTGLGDKIELRDNNALHRHSGTVIIQVFQKERTGTGKANLLAGKAIVIFQRATVCDGESGLIRFRTPSKLPVGANRGWYQINVNCPYIRDTYHSLPTS